MQDRMYERTQSSQDFGSVRLGVAEGYEAALLPGLLKHMWQDHAAAELDIRCQPSWRLLQMIEARTLDLAVVTLPEGSAVGDDSCAEPSSIGWWPQGSILLLRCRYQSLGTRTRVSSEALRPAALKDQGVPHREVLCSADTRVVQAAVEAGTAITVMAEGTVPETLRAISDPSILPQLGKAPIQLLERPGLQSEASGVVKRKLVDAYRWTEAPVH